eukprot:5064696-Amphidinium_carterae.1
MDETEKRTGVPRGTWTTSFCREDRPGSHVPSPNLIHFPTNSSAALALKRHIELVVELESCHRHCVDTLAAWRHVNFWKESLRNDRYAWMVEAMTRQELQLVLCTIPFESQLR